MVSRPAGRSWQVRVSTRGQITVPVGLRRILGLTPATKVDVFPRLDGTFVATPRRPSRILEYAGDLAHLDQENPNSSAGRKSAR